MWGIYQRKIYARPGRGELGPCRPAEFCGFFQIFLMYDCRTAGKKLLEVKLQVVVEPLINLAAGTHPALRPQPDFPPSQEVCPCQMLALIGRLQRWNQRSEYCAAHQKQRNPHAPYRKTAP